MIQEFGKLNAKIPRQFQLHRRVTFHEYRSQWAQSCHSLLSSNVTIQLIVMIIVMIIFLIIMILLILCMVCSNPF